MTDADHLALLATNLEAIFAELAVLREALAWYADETHYRTTDGDDLAAYDDAGQRARRALGQEAPP